MVLLISWFDIVRCLFWILQLRLGVGVDQNGNARLHSVGLQVVVCYRLTVVVGFLSRGYLPMMWCWRASCWRSCFCWYDWSFWLLELLFSFDICAFDSSLCWRRWQWLMNCPGFLQYWQVFEVWENRPQPPPRTPLQCVPRPINDPLSRPVCVAARSRSSFCRWRSWTTSA